MKLETIDNERDFNGIKDKWNSLKASLNYSSPFQTWEWSYLYWKYFGANKELQILVFTDNNKLVAIFPFWIRKLFGINILEPIGTRGTDYINLLLNQTRLDEVLNIFYKWFLKSANDLINVEDFPSTAPYLASFLESAKKLKFAEYVNPTYCPCYRINLPTTRQEYLNTLSNRSRKDTEYYRRYCSNDFNSVEFIRGKYTDIDTHFVLHQKSRSVKNDIGTYKLLEGRLFMKEFTYAMDVSKNLSLRFLSLNNNVVASILGIEEDTKRFNISIGYNPDYRKYRPGTLLYGYDIEDCIHRNLTTYDLSRGSDAYKIRMGTERNYNVRAIVAKSSSTIREYLQSNLKYMEGHDYSPSSV